MAWACSPLQQVLSHTNGISAAFPDSIQPARELRRAIKPRLCSARETSRDGTGHQVDRSGELPLARGGSRNLDLLGYRPRAGRAPWGDGLSGDLFRHKMPDRWRRPLRFESAAKHL